MKSKATFLQGHLCELLAAGHSLEDVIDQDVSSGFPSHELPEHVLTSCGAMINVSAHSESFFAIAIFIVRYHEMTPDTGTCLLSRRAASSPVLPSVLFSVIAVHNVACRFLWLSKGCFPE